jgi:5-methylcytosine-specific restriction protein B
MSGFSSKEAELWLSKRFDRDDVPAEYISAFVLPNGKQLAVQLKRKIASIWLEQYDGNIDGVDLVKHYMAAEGRDANLNTNRGNRLGTGNEADYVKVKSVKALQELVTWYSDGKAIMQEKPYFTKEHFDLLRKWEGQKYDSTDPDQKYAYDQLKEAYGVTKNWADELQKAVFPGGEVQIRRRPTNQANNFFRYNWARIYPKKIPECPREIAFTVGLNCDKGFQLKIDTVHLEEGSALRQKYLALLGEFENSHIVKLLDEDVGLGMGFEELMAWSKREIASLIPEYEKFVNEFQGKNPMKTPMKSKMPLNQILYGPPGTGKTYHTVDRALKILDPEFYNATKKSERSVLKKRFDQLKEDKRIGFVTFHHSFSYEDFVEGLRAKASDDGAGVRYYVEDGIFKILCDQAGGGTSTSSLDHALTLFIEKLEEKPVQLKTSRGKLFTVTYRGNSTFRIDPESSEGAKDYAASIENIKFVYQGGDIKKVYNPSYVRGILNHLTSEYSLNAESEDVSGQSPVVLIIDEINRGNTANIFGELITLIEPSKRAGAAESLSLTLPYSKLPLSVPDNLYIIGTMNTADRSLAHIDTALRRRFVFEEMMPNPFLLKGIVVEGVDIKKMLSMINARIELLYDREHTIGHSFFMGLTSASGIGELSDIFKLQILPLLEEYFFEDWEKIRVVLGDDKKPQEFAFIVEKYRDQRLEELVDSSVQHMLSQSKVYVRRASAFKSPESYIGIYSDLKSEEP